MKPGDTIHWLRGTGLGGDDVVHMTYKGKCNRSDEGQVGFDVRVRPTKLGPGEYTCTIGGGDIEPCPGANCIESERP